MSMIQEVINELHFEDELGAALIGSTAPDRRVMTGQDRSETHYFELTKDSIGDGLKNMKRRYPNIFPLAKERGSSSQAFLLGYVSHLIADETWIVDVYRKYFEEDKYFGKNPLKNIIDRAFQYDIERDIRRDEKIVAFWRTSILDSELTLIDKEFMSINVMESWKIFVLDRITTWAEGWDEFPRLVQRFIDEIDVDQTILQQNLSNPQLMLDEIETILPTSLVTEYRNNVKERTLIIAEEMFN